MAKKFKQTGDVMDYVNGTGNDIASGDVVVATDRVGVALTDIPDTETGSVQVTGVFELPKGASALAQGEKCYWDNTNKYVTGTASGNTLMGYAFVAAAGGDSVAQVKLNG